MEDMLAHPSWSPYEYMALLRLGKKSSFFKENNS